VEGDEGASKEIELHGELGCKRAINCSKHLMCCQ
jgi:hypothetical protein